MSYGDNFETDKPWVTDAVQLNRIESMHRGFLYQHLYAVGCLLNLMSQQDGLVAVERNEDIEINAETGISFVQIKTRNRPIRPSDIETTLKSFSDLRAMHAASLPGKVLRFAIVTNAEPSSDLKKKLESADWPQDIVFSSPGHRASIHALAPPPWPSVESALRWCVDAASQLAFQSLAPETLIWKLAARVQFAASGEDAVRPGHEFRRSDLPALFELFVQQLQEFPSIPDDYRPQPDEPNFCTDRRIQLVTGFSGGGKTIWSSWQARHISAETTYFDIGDLSGVALASSIAREMAARFVSGTGTGAACLPVGTGLEALRYIARAIDLPEPPIVVVDNIHRVDPEHIRQVVEACPTVRFVLMGQPWPQQGQLESLLGLRSDHLPGWDVDTVAAVFDTAGAKISPASARGWRQITSGLPLYVKNAAHLCKSLYAGDASRFLSSIQQNKHSVDLAQEAILELVLENLSPDERRVLAALSLTKLKLTESEAHSLISTLSEPPRNIASTLRALNRKGLVQTFADGARKLHDVLHFPARALVDSFSDAEQLALKCRLRDILFLALQQERDIARLGAWLRLLAPTGRVNSLVDMATHEMFHQVGDPSDLKAVLISTANTAKDDVELEFWALDAVVFWELQEDPYARNPEQFLARLEALVEKHALSARQQTTVIMKRMVVAGMNKDQAAVHRAFSQARPLFENDPQMSRLVRYNYATALFHAGCPREALHISEKLHADYYDLLEIDVSDIVSANPTQMEALFPGNLNDKLDDIKHLADCLALAAMCKRNLGEHPHLTGIHAVKFYQLSGSYRSQMKAAQDVADDFIATGDAVSALQIMEAGVVPLLTHFQFDRNMLDVRGQYASILASNGRYEDARAEMDAIEPYVTDLPPDYQRHYANQRKKVELIAAERAQLTSRPYRAVHEPGPLSSPQINRSNKINRATKVGRNSPCPCGSGKKYKKCCLT